MIAIHVLPNKSIYGSKSNQTMKLGQLNYNKRNIFLQQLCRKQGSKTTISFIIFWDFSMFYQIFLSQ